MSIEQSLERQATALESIAKSLEGLATITPFLREMAKAVDATKGTTSEPVEGKKDSKVADKPAEKAKEAEVVHPSEDDVKKALQGYVARAKELGLDEAKAKDEAKAIVKDVGKADGVSKLAPEQRKAVIDAAGERAKALKAPVAEKKADEVKHPSEEQVRDALRDLSKETSREAAKKLALEHGGAEGVVDIPPEKRKAVIDAAKLALEEAQKAAASGDDF